jgi:hypothetical protein
MNELFEHVFRSSSDSDIVGVTIKKARESKRQSDKYKLQKKGSVNR